VGFITDPRFVVLDTASISNAASKRHDVAVKELMEIFRAGNWIPFVTYHPLEEIACHEGDEIFETRIAFSLSCLASDIFDNRNKLPTLGAFSICAVMRSTS